MGIMETEKRLKSWVVNVKDRYGNTLPVYVHAWDVQHALEVAAVQVSHFLYSYCSHYERKNELREGLESSLIVEI